MALLPSPCEHELAAWRLALRHATSSCRGAAPDAVTRPFTYPCRDPHMNDMASRLDWPQIVGTLAAAVYHVRRGVSGALLHLQGGGAGSCGGRAAQHSGGAGASAGGAAAAAGGLSCGRVGRTGPARPAAHPLCVRRVVYTACVYESERMRVIGGVLGDATDAGLQRTSRRGAL